MAPWPHDVSQDLRARHFNAASRYGQSRRGGVSFVAQIGNRHAHSSMLKRKRWLTLETCRGHWLVIVYVLIQLQKQTSAGFTLQVHVPYSGWVHLSILHVHKWNTSDLLYTDLKIAQSMHFFPPLTLPGRLSHLGYWTAKLSILSRDPASETYFMVGMCDCEATSGQDWRSHFIPAKLSFSSSKVPIGNIRIKHYIVLFNITA